MGGVLRTTILKVSLIRKSDSLWPVGAPEFHGGGSWEQALSLSLEQKSI